MLYRTLSLFSSTALLVIVLKTSIAHAATGIGWIDTNTNLTVTADVRLRYEVDWDSKDASGVERDDRHRGRIRARLGAGYALSDDWSVGARVRTGSSDSQQSPHLTFVTDDGTNDALDFVADRYFVQFKRGAFKAWGGRNTTPFWQQNELFWDEDVTPTGLAGSYDQKISTGTLTATGGAFYLPDGGVGLNGRMVAGQLKYALPITPSLFTTAIGLHYIDGETGSSHLRNGNGDRDYVIGTASVQWSIPVSGRPLTVGADVSHNFKDYTLAELGPLAPINADETLGYVLSLQWGQLKQSKDWIVGYYYAHIETLAVNGSYAQDDWFRFGKGPQTDASDFQGHEVRLGYAFSKNLNLVARLFLVNAITTVQDGNRFRIDLNWKY
jgi:hypothetical protein